MQAEHVIARCTWLTEFDERSAVANLQDFISHWSHTVLHDELERCFRHWCPAPQTWRLPALQLDLGEVALDDLARTLPLRIRAALDDAMRRLFASRSDWSDHAAGSDPGADGRERHRADGGARAGGTLRVLDPAAAMKTLLAYYLQNGNLPWWCGRDVNALEMLDQVLAAPGRASLGVLRTVLRDVGRSESVRKRLVWQLGAGRMARIVHLLEPWHGGFICGWTDSLCAAQAQHQIAPATPSGLRDVIWLTVLTHLLVDRGSVFNNVAFMRASLWQTAQRYQLDYRQLLSRLLLAAEAMASAGLVAHDFFVALGVLGAQDLAPQDHALILAHAVHAHALAGLPSARLWRRLAAIDGQLVTQWLQCQPDPAALLVTSSTERPLGALTGQLLARLPSELRSPRAVVRQWSAVLRQGGLWQGTSAVLERHLYEVFWQVGFGAGAHARGAGELLARMMASACQRLGFTVAQCLAAFQARPQLLVASPWRAGAAWLQRRCIPPARAIASTSPATIRNAAGQAPVAGKRLTLRTTPTTSTTPTKLTKPGVSTLNDDKPVPAARDIAGFASPTRINNAGLVILQGFFMPYLMRLELVKDRQFVSEQARRQAVHCLQFLVSGQSQTQEQYLALNKLLCGLPLPQPLEPGFDMTPSQVQLGEGLLRSVIGHWSAIGSSSIDGFRGNWLVRDATLADAGDHWDLVVERRAYDILLARAPMSYSVITLPWMAKPIYVTWPT